MALLSDLLEAPHPASSGGWVYNVQQFVLQKLSFLCAEVKPSLLLCQWYR